VSTAIIGTGGIGSAIARVLSGGGEALRLSSANPQAAEHLSAVIGGTATACADNRSAVDGADAVILALRFAALQRVIDEIADDLEERSVLVPSNPVGLDAAGGIVRLLPDGTSAGATVSSWLPPGARRAMAFGSMSADLLVASSNRSPEAATLFYVSDDPAVVPEVERLIRTAGFEPLLAGGMDQSTRLEVGGDLHDLVLGPSEARAALGGASLA
jgi:8-hydroxy-5-deazaflavin:NADPH oxidoreductase